MYIYIYIGKSKHVFAATLLPYGVIMAQANCFLHLTAPCFQSQISTKRPFAQGPVSTMKSEKEEQEAQSLPEVDFEDYFEEDWWQTKEHEVT